MAARVFRHVKPVRVGERLIRRADHALPWFRWRWQWREWLFGSTRDRSTRVALGMRDCSGPMALHAAERYETLAREFADIAAELRAYAATRIPYRFTSKLPASVVKPPQVD